MTIRWRLGVVAVQLFMLLAVTYDVTGIPVSSQNWFMAGLFAVVINPPLLEPWHTKPQDALVNSTIALALYYFAPKTFTSPGWTLFFAFLVVLISASLLTLVLGAGRDEGFGVATARSAKTFSKIGSATIVFSVVFWLSTLEFASNLDDRFWKLSALWAALMLVGHINWQAVWATATKAPLPCLPEGMIGPSVLLVSSTSLPESGQWIRVGDGEVEAEGVVITRIHRPTDSWAEVLITDAEVCQRLVRRPALTIRAADQSDLDLVGAVDAGSTDHVLRFVTMIPLRVGDVVQVAEGHAEVLYQISHAEIDRSNVRGGSHLIVRARAVQIGEYDAQAKRLRRHSWVPAPGKPVRRAVTADHSEDPVPGGWMRLGFVLGTYVPVFLDRSALSETHLAILGMTRMGKSSLAVRLAQFLGEESEVIILDQTGEYTQKRKFPIISKSHPVAKGVCVFEPAAGEIAADRGLECLEWIMSKGSDEYRKGDPAKRTVFVEEAHQFVPETAGMGFGAPGRDSSMRFGTLMMQVRKYGISVVLISQRTAVVAKSALSQCENLIAFKSVDQTGLDYLQSLMGEEARSLLPTLSQGQALVFGPAFSADTPVVVQVEL